MNYNQIHNLFDFEIQYKSTFIIISQFSGNSFAFFKPNMATNCKCILINNNIELTPEELHRFCSFFFAFDDAVIEDVKEFDFDEFIEPQNVIPFCFNLISTKQIINPNNDSYLDSISNARQFIQFTSQFPQVFSPKNFFFYNLKKTFTLKLKSENKTFDLLDFTQEKYELRFNKPDCYWKTEFLTPYLGTVISLNPFNFFHFLASLPHPDNMPFKYCLATPGNLTPKSFNSLFTSLPDPKDGPYVFLSSNNQEALNYLEMLCSYITFIIGKTITIKHYQSHFVINFFLGQMESPSKMLQLIANIQSSYSNLEKDSSLTTKFPITSSNTATKSFKIISCFCPSFHNSINSCFSEICKHYFLNFKMETI